MHRYRVEFTSKSVDEARLRNVLEEHFKLSGIVIIRDSTGPYNITPLTPTPVNELQARLLDCLADGKPWRRKAIIEKLNSVASAQSVYRTLREMVGAGTVVKARHGVFISVNAPIPEAADIPALTASGGRPSHHRLLDLLREPKSAPALREALGVSRQRVDQLLKAMLRGDLIRRFEVAGERGSFLYVCKDNFKRGDLLARTPELSPSRARLLSALSPETLSRLRDVTARANSFPASRYLDQLAAMGLAVVFKLGQQRYVGITPRGFQHPQYDRKSPKAPPANIIGDFGEVRVCYIQYLQALGEAKTIDLTFAMPKGYFDNRPRGSGQVMQQLEMANLIAEVAGEKGRQPSYRLSEKGHFVAGVLARIRPLVSSEALRQAIATRRQEYIERLRSIQQHARGRSHERPSILGPASPTQASIVRALYEHGRLSTVEIVSRMDVKFKNSRSINLSLQSLEKRGVVQRVGTKGQAHLWEVTRAGLSESALQQA